MQHSNQAPMAFSVNEDGTVSLDNGANEEMDLAAERIAREMLTEPQ
jgi:hypothetical protein